MSEQEAEKVGSSKDHVVVVVEPHIYDTSPGRARRTSSPGRARWK